MKSGTKIKWKYLSNIKTINIKGDLSEIQDNLSLNDYFSKPGIHIVATNPGTGKSTDIKKKIKNLNKCLILTSSHNVIESEYDIPGLKKWRGFDRHPHEYHYAEELYSLGVPIRLICKRCISEQKCSYYQQFENANKVVAPSKYLESRRINKSNKINKPFKFQNLIIDEDIWGTTELKMDKDELKEILEVVRKYSGYDYENFLQDINSMDFFLYEMLYHDELMKFKIIAFNTALKSFSNKNEYIKKDINKIDKLRPDKIRKFYYYKQIYPDMNSYHEPNIYNVFDISRQGVPVVLLDATFDEDIYKILFSKYCAEDEKFSRSVILPETDLTPLNEIKTVFYKSRLLKRDANIYRLNKYNQYFESAFFKKKKNEDEKILTKKGLIILKKFNRIIRLFKRKYSNVSIITSKSIKEELTKNKLSEGCLIEHYYDMKGLNKMKDSDAIILFATPPISLKVEIENYNKILGTDFKTKDFEFMEYGRYNHNYYETEFKDFLERTAKKRGELAKNQPNEKLRDQIKNNTNKFIEKTALKQKIPLNIKFKNGELEDSFHRNFDEQQDSGLMDAYLYYMPMYFINSKVNSLIYQALLRGRIYRRDGIVPDIFMFCFVPNNVHIEFNPRYYDLNETKRFFEEEFNGRYPLVLKKQIDSHNSNNVKDIAKDLKIYVPNRRSLNTKFVTTMKNNDYNKIKMIDQCIKQGLTKTTDFYKKYKSLRSLKTENGYEIKDFINDCVFYAKNAQMSKK